MGVIESLDLLIIKKMTEDLTRRWSINELSLELKKHYRPVHAAIHRMLKDGILYKDQNSLISPSYIDTHYLEIGEYRRLKELKDKNIRIIADRIVNKIPDTYFTAVLFGSSLRKKGRDIDLLFILPDSADIDEFRNKADSALISFSSVVDINIVTEKSAFEMLNRPNELNVMNELLKGHLVLSGREAFYRILWKWKNDN